MGQVKRYLADVACGPMGNYEERDVVLLSDHASCVQDVRRMAELLQSRIWEHKRLLWPNSHSEAIKGFVFNDPSYIDAQRVMETWKEGA